MQTEVMHYSIQNLKIPEIIVKFPRLELTSDAGRFVPLWGSSDFFQIGLVSKKFIIVG